MASSLRSSSLHVSFDSVLAMDDTGIVAMFGALVASGLKGFLGCPAFFYEDALTEFFQNGSVRDGMVFSTIQGTSVEISEEIFAGAFELPMDGLTDLSEIPEDLVFAARSSFSNSGKQVSTSCKKREIKIEFRLLSDILAKSIFVKAGSFDAVNHERFLLMAAITGGVQINWGSVKEQQLQIFAENESSVDASAAYIVTELEAETVNDQGTDIPHVVSAAADKVSDDESMTLEEILLTIPAYCPLPSALGEITKLKLGESILIPRVNEGDWYKASLPKISVDAKGKAPLMIVDPIEDFYAKEEKVLTWAETDSTREALQRRMYILTKYRELLTRKFVEAYKSNFVPGEGSSATDLKVLDMLSNLQLFLLEELNILMQAHGLTWDRTCCSKMFEGKQRYRGAVIARSNPNIRSSCWIRTMILVNGTWVIEPCADYWRRIPQVVASRTVVIPSRLSYVDTLPPVSGFLKLLKKRWADVCIKAQMFSLSGKLLPVGSLNFCRAIAVVEPTSVFGSRRPTVTHWGWYQLCTVFPRFCLFGGLSTVDIRNFVSTIAEDRSVLRDIQLGTFSVSIIPHIQSVSSSEFVDQSVQLFLDQRPNSPSTSADSSMHFVEDDTHLGDYAASNLLSPPVVSANFSVSFDDLKASISHLVARQKKDTRRLDDSQNYILSKLNKLEKDILAALHQHEEANRSMIQNVRQEAQTQSDALSVKLNDFRKGVQGHSAFVTSDLADVLKEQKTQRAMIESLDEQVAAIRNDLLDFCAKAEENHLNLSTQLGFLVDYINRGGDAKKGEGGNSRPQPPPDDQERPSGGSTGRGSSGGDGSQRRSDKGGSSESKKTQRAMIESLDEQVAAIRNDLLDFCAKAEENHLNLSTQLGFLVDYINRGGDAKKGEGGNSRPQPPPDDQERPSGGSTGRGSSGGDGSQRRSDRGGSSKKRHCSTGGSGSGSGSGRVTYGPYLPLKRDAEYWIYGKRQF
ncbi:hypothetical protein F511_22010 [Dorcoceras hygrometricum]|uniref:Uncharacterized protein n=1 Tax=Dorcoceras hygrometricum TaxID=472368 RepID=A0A2Z7BAS8_9LAMI|nr:hypothetical protein F511_22010 [Dorcoceras hygrometricum]